MTLGVIGLPQRGAAPADRPWHGPRRRARTACAQWLDAVLLGRPNTGAADACLDRARRWQACEQDTVLVWASPAFPSEAFAVSVSTLMSWKVTSSLGVALLTGAPRELSVDAPERPWALTAVRVPVREVAHLPSTWKLTLPEDTPDVVDTAARLAGDGMRPGEARAAARALMR